MDYLYGFASSISKDLLCGAVNQLRYPCCFNNFVEQLAKEEGNLIATRDSVQNRVAHAKKQTRKTSEVGDKWLKDANIEASNVNQLLKEARIEKSFCFGHCPNWFWRYRIGKKLANRKGDIEKRIKEGRNYIEFESVATLPSGTHGFLSERCLNFESRQPAYEQLMEALKDDEVTMIGLYGMGGCGKTTLAMEIRKKAEAEQLFDEVIFVPVSSTVEVRRIQEKIASSIQYTFPENEELERAQRLYMRLTQENKILVVLDDVWEKLDFGAIGIPSVEHHKGCKVLITTRSEEVCTLMDCQKKIQLPILTDEEAWTLFQKQAHIFEGTSDTLKHLGRKISDECKGLPVAIAAVASSLKGKAEVVWRVALNRFTGLKPLNIGRGLQNPYTCLQLSYDNLDTEEAKSLFLLWLGVVGDVHSYEEARNEVIEAKIKLLSSCLLLGVDDKSVQMHDLVRHVARRIAKDENKIIEMLRVLFLYNKGRRRRPLSAMSFKSLTNLRCILLRNWELGDISFLGDVKKLESLTLHNCLFLELPDVVVTQLKNLRLLDLSECDMKHSPFEVIGRHPQLEELYFVDHRSKWDFYNEHTAEFFQKFRVPQVLQRYHIHLGIMFAGFQEEFPNRHRTLFLSYLDPSNAAVKDLAKKAEVLCLANIEGSAKNILPDIFQIGGGMDPLIELLIRDSKIECLIDTSHHLSEVGAQFSNLHWLRIEHMKNLGALYHGSLPPIGHFEKLQNLHLSHCPKLTWLFTHAVAQNMVQLEKLEIASCLELKHLVTNYDDREEISTNDKRLLFPKLKRLHVRECDNLEYLIPITYAQGLVQLECLEIVCNNELKYLFGQCTNGDHLVEYLIFLSNLMVSMLLQDSRATCMMIKPKLVSVIIDNSSKVKDIFHLEGFPTNGQEVTSCLDTLKLFNLPELTYVWTISKHFVSPQVQHLRELHICNCPKLKAIFSVSISRVLPLLKILVVEHCEELEHIIEDEKENENVSNPQAPKVCFSQLKFLLVTHCNNLKHLFFISISHEFPELEYLILNQNSRLVQVFESEAGVREGRVEILLPKLKHVVLMQQPDLINFCQGIEFQIVINLLVHNCPKFSLTSTTTVEDMLQISNSGKHYTELYYQRCK
uniref:Disease resistance protein At4g27190 family n=1 Tax=Cajanus cajan TaxID=3821 RepID=A0A151SW94_CAJCA|nr:Disease resistance protein At4g27190 family [Cajanus cajan]